MVWDGEERRASNREVEAVRSELSAVKNALYEVAEGMSHVVPRTEVEDMVIKERRDRYRTTMFLAGAIAVLLAFVTFSVAQLAAIEDIAENNRRSLDQLNCAVKAAAQAPGEGQRAAFAECALLDE